MDFVCPKCGGALSVFDGGIKRCALGHSFDRAKEGYYNLLLGVGGGAHGDNELMLRARRDFLDRGYYEPLAKALTETVLSVTGKGGALLDAGCGEGYYTNLVERALFQRDGGSMVLAFDISKAAVKMTAKRNKAVKSAVASAYAIPLSDSSVDTVMNVFSPMAISETLRVLKTGGRFVLVYPDRDHLFSLKAAIYNTPYKNAPEGGELSGMRLDSVNSVAYTMDLDTPEAINSLFMMTPYAYRTSEAGRVRLSALTSLKCEAQFLIATYTKM